MLISGRREVYKVKWDMFGYSSHVPIIYVKRPCAFFGLWGTWKLVWKGNTRKVVHNLGQMYSEQIKTAFENIVEEYEKYADVWDEENWKV